MRTSLNLSRRVVARVAGLVLGAALAVTPHAAGAQGTTGRITGTVLGERGQPLPAAQLSLVGTQLGASADDNGRFTINGVVPGTYQLRAQRIGYAARTQAVTVAAGQTTTANVQLDVIAVQLQPVVVGYTTEQRRDVTGAVSSVSGADIRDQKVATVEEAIRGRVPGVQVNASGEPGRAPQIIVRGQNGFGNPSPLYVVDGMYLTENPNLNPDDVESIEVLKDASAAAQYGAQASNGVIVISTRRGRAGNNEVALHTYYGTQSVPKRIKMMNTAQWQALNQTAFANAKAQDPSVVTPAGVTAATSVNTDWQDAVFQSGAIQDYNLQVSGGTPTARYLLSGGYLDQQGTIVTTTFRRYSFRVNSDAQRGRLSLGENLALSQGTQRSLNGFPLIDVVRMLPTIPVFDSTVASGYGYGTAANPTYGTNPVGELQAQSNKYRSNQVIGTAYGDVQLSHNLRYRLNLGLNYNDSSVANWRSIDQLRYLTPNQYATLSDATSNGTSLLWENLLNYDDSFREGKHRLNAVAGATTQRVDFNRLTAYRQGYSDESLQQISAGSTAGSNNGGFTVPFRTNSVLARANYTFNDRYLLGASGRRDCSSRFGPGNRCGDFGAASLGWVVSEEGFFKSVPVLSRSSFFKIRGSTGVLGDQNIGDFAYVAPVDQNINYMFGNTVVSGAIQQALANANLKWQRNHSTDVGVDVGAMNNDLTLTLDYYRNTADQLLVSAPIPPDLGSSVNPVVNAGKVRNAGFEAGLTHHWQGRKLELNTTFSLTTTRNRVLSLGNGGQPIFAGIAGVARTAVGQPIGEFYVKKVAGIFQSQADVDAYTASVNGSTVKIQPNARPGDIKYADLNGDGKIDDGDRYNAGNGIPKVQPGLFLNALYGNFDVGLNLRGSYGGKIYNVVRYWTDRMDDLNNSRAGLNPWSPTNPSTTTPRAVFGAAGAANADPVSDRWIESGNYTRIQNLVIGYRVPSRYLGRAGLEGAQPRIYLNIQNLHTFTKYTNWDPEILGLGDPLARGIDDGYIYPNPRTVTIGLDLRL